MNKPAPAYTFKYERGAEAFNRLKQTCCSEIIVSRILITKGKATNNFKRHLEDGNISAIISQIKRGSVIIKKFK